MLSVLVQVTPSSNPILCSSQSAPSGLPSCVPPKTVTCTSQTSVSLSYFAVLENDTRFSNTDKISGSNHECDDQECAPCLIPIDVVCLYECLCVAILIACPVFWTPVYTQGVVHGRISRGHTGGLFSSFSRRVLFVTAMKNESIQVTSHPSCTILRQQPINHSLSQPLVTFSDSTPCKSVPYRGPYFSCDVALRPFLLYFEPKQHRATEADR